MTATLILVALALVAACGVFVMAEFAFITVNRSAVEHQAARGNRQAKGLMKALKNLSSQLSGSQVGITITNLAIGFLAEPAVASLLEKPLENWGVPEKVVPSIAVGSGVAIATIVTMVFGELVPKNLALANPLAAAKAVQAFQRFFSALMKVPIIILNGSANFLLKRIHIEPQEELASARSAEELMSVIRRSADQGTLPKETASTLQRTLVFEDLTAQDIVTPRRRIKYVRPHDSIEKLIGLAEETGLSRFPVADKNLDDIVGTVHIKQAMTVPDAERSKKTVSAIKRKPLIVPSNISLDTLLAKLRPTNLHMAVVVDEFGGTSGIVTMEDLLEELVGGIRDEHDHTGPQVRQREDGAWVLSGLLRPDEIIEPLDIVLPRDPESDTLGGLIAGKLQSVPAVGDLVRLTAKDHEGTKFEVALVVERMDGRRVDKVVLWRTGK